MLLSEHNTMDMTAMDNDSTLSPSANKLQNTHTHACMHTHTHTQTKHLCFNATDLQSLMTQKHLTTTTRCVTTCAKIC